MGATKWVVWALQIDPSVLIQPYKRFLVTGFCVMWLGARLWFVDFQIDSPNKPPLKSAVLYDSQTCAERQSRQEWDMPPSSSPNSIANVRQSSSSVVRTVQAEIYIAIFGCSSKMPLRGDEDSCEKRSLLGKYQGFGHSILAPRARIAWIALKTCGIERSRIFTSKLYSDFFCRSDFFSNRKKIENEKIGTFLKKINVFLK